MFYLKADNKLEMLENYNNFVSESLLKKVDR